MGRQPTNGPTNHAKKHSAHPLASNQLYHALPHQNFRLTIEGLLDLLKRAKINNFDAHGTGCLLKLFPARREMVPAQPTLNEKGSIQAGVIKKNHQKTVRPPCTQFEEN
jgi:hypothetical protein